MKNPTGKFTQNTSLYTFRKLSKSQLFHLIAIGNIGVILTIASSKNLRKNPVYILILNLALSDVAISIVVHTFTNIGKFSKSYLINKDSFAKFDFKMQVSTLVKFFLRRKKNFAYSLGHFVQLAAEQAYLTWDFQVGYCGSLSIVYCPNVNLSKFIYCLALNR